ncbi:hypothetical protein N7457_006850 [Penicillium paradoxum]|uniref:uncharacterized protein n=1 Tax=Penicillium paradoxum TaxID=176176 RepID=UPI0025474D7E|nr:uncharacterized protein N7457_006850 [Penicillium paradoxum]KAJ5779130.1 hypothetical protein N7457_006850 [Penicillium paradoxum]
MRSLWMLCSLALAANAQKTTPCPILGSAYPAPKGLSKDPVFLRASEKLTSQLNEAIENGTLPSVSIAVQIFSEDENTAFEFYHTDHVSVNGSPGVQEVDENTMFRIGSISKLWTMFLYMTLEGTRYFHEPVAKYVPELRVRNDKTQTANVIDAVRWTDVTIGELASHQAGIARDYAFGDLGFQSSDVLHSMGFPALPESEALTCGNTAQCNRTDFFTGLLNMHPLTPTSYTPLYSNAGFQILGYALESIANAEYEDILFEQLINPLNLTRSCLKAPDAELAVIPYNKTYSMFDFKIGDAAPAGGMFSSAKDMSTFGRAIFSNALIDPAITRRWLRPMAHTSSLQHSVGAPWEIYSYLTPRRTDLYTKSGDLGLYSSSFGISPDHKIGYTVLVAGVNSHQMTSTISDMVTDTMVPILDEVARNQALKRFGGTYELTGGASNASITITADDGPGLILSSWINNSVDMIESLMALQGVTDRSALTIRLQPSGLEASGRISFLAVIYALPVLTDAGPMLSSCLSWILLESLVYGGVGLPEFEFEVNDNGDATSLSPRALRVNLPRV